MRIIEWHDRSFLLGVPDMDNTHKEFIDLLNRVWDTPDTEFGKVFDELIHHTTLHFQNEEELMLACRFPAIAEHKDEHQRILGELHQFKRSVDKGFIALGRNYIRERMPDWFRLHAATMDSALAMQLKKAVAGLAVNANQ